MLPTSGRSRSGVRRRPTARPFCSWPLSVARPCGFTPARSRRDDLSRLANGGPVRVMHRRCSLATRCSATQPDVSTTLPGPGPGGAHGVHALRSVAPARGPPDVSALRAHLPFFESPTPIIWSGDRPLEYHAPTCKLRPAAGASPRLLGFSPRAIRSRRALRAARVDTALGFGLSQVFGHRFEPACAGYARKLRPIRQPWGPLPVPGRSWSSRRCRFACGGHSAAHLPGRVDVSRVPRRSFSVPGWRLADPD